LKYPQPNANDMKQLLYALFQLSLSTVLGQYVKVTTLDDTCVRIKYFHSTSLDGDHLHIKKDPIPNLIARLKSCHPQFHYSYSFTDHPFELIIPGYLTKIGYGDADEKFEICFYDADDTKGKMVITYDFAGEYQRWFMEHIHDPEEKATERSINGTKVWSFLNQDGQFAGIIFITDYLSIAYYTHSAFLISNLEKALVTFKWE
jgi:hypothetical protein